MRRLASLVLIALASVVASATLPGLPASAVWAQTPDPVTDNSDVEGYDLVRPPSECIGFLPKPDCGREPADAGDRGGTMQYVTFGVILAGLAFIFTVVFRKVIVADRVKADQAYSVQAGGADAQVGPNRTPPSH